MTAQKAVLKRKPAPKKRSKAAQVSRPKAVLTSHAITINSDLSPSPPSLNVNLGDQVTWTGTVIYEIQFTNQSPFLKGKYCAQQSGSNYVVGPITVTLDPGPNYAHCPYKVKPNCSGQTGDVDDDGDGIIIVDCSTCGDNDDHGHKKRKNHKR